MGSEKKNLSKERYNAILDGLIEELGGKEWCLKQLISESLYNNFANNYQEVHHDLILNLIEEKYYKFVNMDFSKENFKKLDVLSGVWIKYIMNLYFYDVVNNRIFEFSIKKHTVTEIDIFEDEDNKIQAKSFFSKIKNGNSLWEKYKKTLDESNSEKINKENEENTENFINHMKKFRMIDEDEVDSLNLLEAPLQYNDGKNRFLSNNVYYYQLAGIDGFITFDSGIDIFQDIPFSKLFYEKIISQLRE